MPSSRRTRDAGWEHWRPKKAGHRSDADRTIIYSPDFEACVARLGGYRIIDPVLEAVIDGLRRNPFGFERFENDLFSFRYARTTAVGTIPPLYVIFTIDPARTVTLVHVEEIV